jgi:hypothetical protein
MIVDYYIGFIRVVMLYNCYKCILLIEMLMQRNHLLKVLISYGEDAA